MDVCQACGIVFIGPNSEIIRMMGNKAQAKATMKAAGVPLMPGSDGIVETVEEALAWGDKIGYPVIVKASAGGGGRGMRIVSGPDEMADMYNTARSEAQAAFTDDTVYMEKYLLEPRAHRGPDPGRPVRQHHHPGGARVLHPAPPPEAHRGEPRPALTPELRKRIGRWACAPPGRWAISTPAPSSSCWTPGANSSSWR